MKEHILYCAYFFETSVKKSNFCFGELRKKSSNLKNNFNQKDRIMFRNNLVIWLGQLRYSWGTVGAQK